MGPRCDPDGAPTKLDYKKKQHGANTVQAFIVRKTNLQNDFEWNTKPSKKNLQKITLNRIILRKQKDIQKAYLRYLLRPGPNLNLQSPDPGAGAEQSTAIALPLFAACEVLADQVKVIHNYVTCVIWYSEGNA